MKTTVIAVIMTACLLFLGYTFSLKKQLERYKEQYGIEVNNRKAFELEKNIADSTLRMYKISMKDLEYSNDSIMKALYKTKQDLKIKDKKITQLQYSLATINRKDTLIFRDTLFRDRSIKIDTTVGDSWFNTNIHLEYPSTIAVSPSAKSEKYVIMHTEKHIQGVPSKLFFVRWFQKKEISVDIHVKENNPYIHSDVDRFIEVIKP